MMFGGTGGGFGGGMSTASGQLPADCRTPVVVSLYSLASGGLTLTDPSLSQQSSNP